MNEVVHRQMNDLIEKEKSKGDRDRSSEKKQSDQKCQPTFIIQ